VIEFHLDGHSRVATYMQVVQQVKEALRTGLIGDNRDPNTEVHRVRNTGSERAISLHVYGVAGDAIDTGINRVYA